MPYLNKHLVRTLEQQHKRTVRGLYLKIQHLNKECSLLIKRLSCTIDLTPYQAAIDYVDQYVAHTSILNLKFITNTQNLEVVVLHALLLDYILSNETTHSFDYEKQLLKHNTSEILALNEHASSLFANHKEKMLDYIDSKNN